MNYKHIRSFLIRRLEVALQRKWIDKADKIAEILLKINEVAPKRVNPYLPEDYRKRLKELSREKETQ